MAGNTIIVILLVPLLFQVVYLAVRQTRRHREIQEQLRRIEELLQR